MGQHFPYIYQEIRNFWECTVQWNMFIQSLEAFNWYTDRLMIIKGKSGLVSSFKKWNECLDYHF